MQNRQPLLNPCRRTFLQGVAGTALLFSLPGCNVPARPIQPAPAPSGPTALTTSPATMTEITLTASAGSTPILAGATTTTWGYRGEVIQGDPGTVQAIPSSYLGPILRLHKGQQVRVNLHNALDEETIIHWHGLIVPSAMDGHPADSIAPGADYTYEFEVKNRAGTYWFHPHPHGRTAYQAYMGLAGLVIVTDDEEAALALPTGAYDLPLVIQDRTFAADNQLVYLADAAAPMPGMDHSGSGMQGTTMNSDTMTQTMGTQMMGTQTMGFLGERILVNGQPDLVLPVATRVYRLRLLNGSNARIYKLAWSNGAPLTVIGTDGGLLAQPQQRTYLTLAPGERIELWADFSQLAVGDELKLQSLAYSGVEAGMLMNGMLMAMPETVTLPNGAPFDLLTVRVDRAEAEPLTLPVQLATVEKIQPDAAINASQPRPFALGMRGGQWQINGKTFNMLEVDDTEKVALGSVEIWEFINELNNPHSGHGQSGGSAAAQAEMVDFMAHPIHIHGVQFQVLKRQIDPDFAAAWGTLRDGFVDDGWKDTVLVMPGERVQVGLRFVDYPGRYLVHCHNLEHENAGMMRNFLIS